MEIYLVGGAVRDELLDVPFYEKDWVVVGARPSDLLEQGYTQVGKDFPVFLHPDSKEEFALARTERKQGHGYTGFDVDAQPTVTLEEDLKRRDLTINAMARDPDGHLIDPYGGQRDIEARLLRHVSPAFTEDPLRVLRTARFAARYARLGFAVAPETGQLMSEIAASGELDHLSPERVWTETERALGEDNPTVYVEVLRRCGALTALFPEIDALFGVPQPEQHHPEGDAGLHTLQALAKAAELSPLTQVRFAVLMHDVGKAATPADQLPRHIGHETRGVTLINALCDRLRVPNRHRELALATCEYHLLAHRALELKGSTLLQLLEATGALRDSDRFDGFLVACEADACGRGGREPAAYLPAAYLREARDLTRDVSAAGFVAAGLKGKAIGDAIRVERVRRLEALRAGHAKQPDSTRASD